MNKFYLQLEEEIKTNDGESLKDEELVMKAVDNPRLFEIFVDRYQDVFLRTAGRVLRSKEDSEDAVQEAFVKIYKNSKKYKKQPGIAFKSWAFKVLMNCVFTRYRKMKRNFNDSEYMDQLLYSGDENIDNTFEKKERRDEIESVLDGMPEELSDLMKEHYLKDRPYAEIASAKGISLATLKMKLFRARKKFKEVLEDM